MGLRSAAGGEEGKAAPLALLHPLRAKLCFLPSRGSQILIPARPWEVSVVRGHREIGFSVSRLFSSIPTQDCCWLLASGDPSTQQTGKSASAVPF